MRKAQTIRWTGNVMRITRSIDRSTTTNHSCLGLEMILLSPSRDRYANQGLHFFISACIFVFHRVKIRSSPEFRMVLCASIFSVVCLHEYTCLSIHANFAALFLCFTYWLYRYFCCLECLSSVFPWSSILKII